LTNLLSARAERQLRRFRAAGTDGDDESSTNLTTDQRRMQARKQFDITVIQRSPSAIPVQAVLFSRWRSLFERRGFTVVEEGLKPATLYFLAQKRMS
jgi:hypothetical protein